MGMVRVELPFKGLDCNDCVYEDDANALELSDHCWLFDDFKESKKRCVKCVNAELREA